MKIKEVEVSVLKKRKRQQITQDKKLHNIAKKVGKKKKGKRPFLRAEYFVKQEMKNARDRIRLFKNTQSLVKTNEGNDDDNTPPKLVVVVRLAKEKEPMSRVTAKALWSLRLSKQYSATFALLTSEVRKAIKIAEPYLTYGEPSLRTVRELLFKRGYLKNSEASKKSKAAKPIPLMDNTLIEKHLGSHGIICIEDVVHEIFSRGSNFDAVNSFVGKFMLGHPSREEKDKKAYEHVDVGGSFGCRGEAINAFVQSMI